jgi:hypothetical protein
VLKITKNEVEQLNHGWYIIRNYSTREIHNSVTIKEYYICKREFFATTAP